MHLVHNGWNIVESTLKNGRRMVEKCSEKLIKSKRKVKWNIGGNRWIWLTGVITWSAALVRMGRIHGHPALVGNVFCTYGLGLHFLFYLKTIFEWALNQVSQRAKNTNEKMSLVIRMNLVYPACKPGMDYKPCGFAFIYLFHAYLYIWKSDCEKCLIWLIFVWAFFFFLYKRKIKE